MAVGTSLRELLGAGRISEALAKAGEALQVDPRDVEAGFVAAVALAESGRVADALKAIGAVLKAEPENAEYLAQQARFFLLARREADALAAARGAVAAGSSDPLVLDTIGCVFARLGAHDEALPLFETAVRSAPDVIEFQFNLGSTLGFLRPG